MSHRRTAQRLCAPHEKREHRSRNLPPQEPRALDEKEQLEAARRQAAGANLDLRVDPRRPFPGQRRLIGGREYIVDANGSLRRRDKLSDAQVAEVLKRGGKR